MTKKSYEKSQARELEKREKRDARELDKRIRFQSLPYRESYRDIGQLSGYQLAVHVTPDNEEFFFTHNDDWTNVFYVETPPSRSRLRRFLSFVKRRPASDNRRGSAG